MLIGGLGAGRQAQAQLFDQVRDPSIVGVGTEPGVTVLSRQRPEYDYPAVRLGSVLLTSELTSSTGYDDNVLGTSSGRGSLLQQTQLTAGATTNWSRNGITASLQANDYRFLDLPSQSYTTWAATAGGTYQVGRDTIALNYYHQNLSQTPRDLDTAQLDSPIAYRIDTVDASYNLQLNRLSLRPELQVSRYDYDNGTVGGQVYRQEYRDRIVYTPQMTVTYELAPQREAVVVVRNATAGYTSQQAGDVVRDYNDTSVLAGLDYQSAGPWRFRALVGYETRSFTSRQFKTIQAPVAELSVIWTPTGLTTVTASLSRHIADSSDESTAALTTTSASLAVDHELWRNVLLHGQAGIEVASFGQGGGSQALYTLGAGATWLLNRHMRLGANYTFTSRENGVDGLFGGSTTGGGGQPTGGNYIENRILLQLRLGF